MAANDSPKTIGEVIDDVERLREELLTLQRSLEKIELGLTPASNSKLRRVRKRPRIQTSVAP